MRAKFELAAAQKQGKPASDRGVAATKFQCGGTYPPRNRVPVLRKLPHPNLSHATCSLCRNYTVDHCSTNHIRISDFLKSSQKCARIVQDRMYRLAPQARIVSICHGSTVRELPRKEVSQPHSLQASFSFPRTVCVSVEARDCDDAEVIAAD